METTRQYADDLALIGVLDAARGPSGPLNTDARRRLFAVIDTPDAHTWMDARGVHVTPTLTLGQAVTLHFPGAMPPTGAQINAALAAAVRTK